MARMRIAVTSCMLNEPPEFVERWTKSALDADEMVLVDTGSTNDAVQCALDLGVTVHRTVIRQRWIRAAPRGH
jgi:cellulose synthase/poly-beta-1,6-N-acetylglucosamine synthase-like glycosyltransferase